MKKINQKNKGVFFILGFVSEERLDNLKESYAQYKFEAELNEKYLLEEIEKEKNKNEELQAEIEALKKKETEIRAKVDDYVKRVKETVRNKDKIIMQFVDEREYLKKVLSTEVHSKENRQQFAIFYEEKERLTRDFEIVYIYSQAKNITETAKIIGLDRSTVSRILKKYREMEPLKENEIRRKYFLNDDEIKKMAKNRVKKYREDQLQNIYLDELKL